MEDVLRPKAFDAALLVTPPEGHLEQCNMIFAAGLPLLAEKPLASSLGDAVAIVEAAEHAGLPLSVGLNFRYLPCSRVMREWLTGSRLGKVGFGQFSYLRYRDGKRPKLNRYPLTMQHPMMLEQTIHHFDLIRFCHAREVTSIVSRGFNPPWSMYAHDANVHCMLQLEGGIEVNYFGTWAGAWKTPDFEWRIDCENGVLVQRELHSDLTFAMADDPELQPIPLEQAEPYYDDSVLLLRDFVVAVKNSTPPPCDGDDHLRSLSLCFASIESAERSTVVQMGDFYARHGLERLS
jgi:predicted dehydrogenase